jgi:hypothetical protein
MPLKKDDASVLRSMRKGGVLRDIQSNRIDAHNGVILVACGDGDQFYDLFSHKAEILAPQRGAPRIHPLTLNGGGLLIPENSPFNKDLPHDRVLLTNIAGAMKLKEIYTVALCVHAPCGMARSAGLDFETMIRLLVEAKRRIRCEIQHPELKVAAFCHVDWEDGKRTYHVSADAWDKWREAPPMSIPPGSLSVVPSARS